MYLQFRTLILSPTKSSSSSSDMSSSILLLDGSENNKMIHMYIVSACPVSTNVLLLG